MKGINRAVKDQKLNNAWRILESVSDNEIPCIFISYQRKDVEYASDVADYIISKQIDFYFDLNDSDLKFHRQSNDQKRITSSIQKGLKKSDYMLVIISPTTLRSPWVPFEVGYAYDDKGENLKLLRHKGINKTTLPSYLRVKDMLNGATALNEFLSEVRSTHFIYESLLEKGLEIPTFSSYYSNPLNKYLDNE